jgi:hypothetical protein
MPARNDKRLFTLDVFIFGGPITEKFWKKSKIVSRIIQIRGDQTLEDLHNAIFEAFDREEEHLYEFQVGGKEPHDRDASNYVHEFALEGPFGDETKHKGIVHDTRIGSLKLKPRQYFFYWFDFGDSWWHKITVASIEETAPSGQYPKITARVGDSPPQYPDEEE